MNKEEELTDVCEAIYQWFRYSGLRSLLQEQSQGVMFRNLISGFDTHQESLIKVLGKKN